MRKTVLLPAAIATAIAAHLLPAHAAGTVQVTYVKPENFSDVGRSVYERERTLRTLTAYFEQLAQRLADGQTLKLDVTEVDLAGQLKPTRTGEELRVLNGGADWPRISLRYTLQAGNSAVKAGDAELRDMNYQFGTRSADFQRNALGYEKRMIDAWFGTTFAAP